jgi:hypothetical protein
VRDLQRRGDRRLLPERVGRPGRARRPRSHPLDRGLGVQPGPRPRGHDPVLGEARRDPRRIQHGVQLRDLVAVRGRGSLEPRLPGPRMGHGARRRPVAPPRVHLRRIHHPRLRRRRARQRGVPRTRGDQHAPEHEVRPHAAIPRRWRQLRADRVRDPVDRPGEDPRRGPARLRGPRRGSSPGRPSTGPCRSPG